MQIRTFEPGDESRVVELWIACELTRPTNNPLADIARKVATGDDLFLVGEVDGAIVATVMAGYDGHRGWVNYLAVDPGSRNDGLARRLMREAERRLLALGCPKVNLQVRSSNREALAFYERIGDTTDDVVSFGRRLVVDDPYPISGSD